LKVSIVIPVYNSERFLRESIDSALNQTYKDIEVIAVYDKSEDRTLDILKEYSDKIKIIDKQSGGPIRALNDGIKSMTGEWFKYLGSDDILYPNAIEELISETKKLQGRNFILYSSYEVINSDGKKMYYFNEPNYNTLKNFDYNIIFLDNYISNFVTTMIHKSLFEKYGMFDESPYDLAKDYELYLRYAILHDCRLHLVPKILVKYRDHPDTITNKKLEDWDQEYDMVKRNILSKLDSSLRLKYEEGLKQYRKKRPLRIKTKRAVKYILYRLFPESVQNKIFKAYRVRWQRGLAKKG